MTSSRQATIAIQVQPVMIAIRWKNPVGAFGHMPVPSIVETVVLAMNMTMIPAPTASE